MRLVYNSKEASALLGISQSTLLRLTADKKIKKIQLSKKRVGWTHAELIHFLDRAVSFKADQS